jgi:molybdopterin-guanine dinucleotide biosynthesis protein A
MRSAAFLLAGGQSRRLGEDKRFLGYEGKPLLVGAYEAAAAVSDEIWALLADPRDEPKVREALGHRPIRFAFDPEPRAGPLGALASALSLTSRDYVLVLAVDYPLITGAFLSELKAVLADRAEKPDVFAPRWQGVPQVACAFYRTSLASELQTAFERGERSLRRWVEGLSAERVMTLPEDVWRAWADESAFLNVNTPEDVERLLRRDRRRG